MSGQGSSFASWWLHTAAGGGLLLLLALAVMQRCWQPAWRQRVGEWGMAAALILAVLSVGPSWLVIPLLSPESNGPSRDSCTAMPPGDAGETTTWTGSEQSLEPDRLSRQNFRLPSQLPLHDEVNVAASTQELTNGTDLDRFRGGSEEPAANLTAGSSSLFPKLLNCLAAAYLAGVVFFLVRWLIGHFALWRLLTQTQAAPDDVRHLFEQMARGQRPLPRLLTSRRLRVPMSCGLWRPAVVVPEELCKPAARQTLSWVFAHELTHIERRDARACLLFGLGQVFYFYVPWLWSLRRQVRLCQEYIADAAAAGRSGAAEDYAEFLLSLTNAPALPLGTTGVTGNSSDLFRRITMLLKSRTSLETRCPRWWSLLAAGGLLALAVLVAGFTLRAEAAPSNAAADATVGPVPEPGKTNPLPKKDEPARKDQPLNAPGEFVPGLGGEAGQMREQMMKRREEMLRRMPQMQQMQMNQAGMAGMMGFGNSSGRLGVLVQSPSETLTEQLDLPRNKGLVVTQVDADSAAAKAGIKAHDILLELNGKSVASTPNRLVRDILELKADTPIDAVVLRKGKRETIKGIKLPEVKPDQMMFGALPQPMQAFNPNLAKWPAMQAAPPLPNQGADMLALPLPPLAALPGMGAVRQPGMDPRTVITSNFRTGDGFITRHQEGSLIITVTGKVDDGRSKISQIQIQDGTSTAKYEKVDKVPEQYRDKVKNLIEVNEKSNVRIELKANPDDKRPPSKDK